ncbi:hypothetical protein ACFV84_35175 [Kitasatospora sp. NPDC059811]|uniref:hypothetical protein n=1 Tax=Streptomycetaceae TaxID=2062 RepID=UPI0007AF60FD|nr:hypothetical protein [Streptomyces sp. MJM8645]
MDREWSHAPDPLNALHRVITERRFRYLEQDPEYVPWAFTGAARAAGQKVRDRIAGPGDVLEDELPDAGPAGPGDDQEHVDIPSTGNVQITATEE